MLTVRLKEMKIMMSNILIKNYDTDVDDHEDGK
jgi:hypothetical protein